MVKTMKNNVLSCFTCHVMKFLGFMKKQNNMSMMQKADYSMVDCLNRFSHGQDLTWMHT
jgi:nitrate/TMAO reductase-like tetraheme cytochrome c subunit